MAKRADQPERSQPKLGYIEGLLYKFIRPMSEAPGEGFVTPVRGKNQDGNTFVPGYFPESAQNIKSVNTGHLEIQNDEIIRMLAKTG